MNAVENCVENLVKTVDNQAQLLKVKKMHGPDDQGRVVVTMNDGKLYLLALTQTTTELLDAAGEPTGLAPVYDGVLLKGFRKAE